MTPERFNELAKQIAGKYWKSRLPEMTGRSRSYIYEYSTGKRPVSKSMEAQMETLAKYVAHPTK